MLIDQKDFKKDIKGEPFHSLDTPPPPPRPPSPSINVSRSRRNNQTKLSGKKSKIYFDRYRQLYSIIQSQIYAKYRYKKAEIYFPSVVSIF